MRPLKTLVLVKPDEPDAYSGLLIIPDSCKRRKNKGTIIATGEGTSKEPMLLKTGASVFNIKDCGTPVMYNNEEHYFIEQRDILAQDIS
jgi:co-chaperonin GroES (HSP10)